MRGDGRVYQRSDRWWLEFWYKGNCYREPTMVADRSGVLHPAKTEVEALKRLQAAARSWAGTSSGREERVTVEELCDDLVTHLRTKGARSLASFESHLKPVRGALALTRAVELTSDKIEAFIQAQLEAGAKPATVNRRTGALRQALHLATKARKLSRARVPFGPMLTQDNARSGFVEPATFELIAAHLPDPVADIARFAYHSAWRRGEVLPLRWDSVNRTNREARPRTSKNKRPRTLPLAGVLWEVIERRWQAREYQMPEGVTGLSEYVSTPATDTRPSTSGVRGALHAAKPACRGRCSTT